MIATASILVEIEMGFQTDDDQHENVAWHWCNEHATFKHPDAPEFIVDLRQVVRGYEKDEADHDFGELLLGIRRFAQENPYQGSVEQLIQALVHARDMGACRVLLWA